MNNYIESETIPLVAEDEEELPGLQDVPSSHEEEDAISDELAVGIEEQEELEESPSLDAMPISHEEEFATEYESSEDSDLYSTQQETIPDEPTSDIEAKLEGAEDHVSQITNILEEIEELPELQDVPSSHEAGEEIDSLGDTIPDELAVGIEEEQEEIEESPSLDAMPISHEEDNEINPSEDSLDSEDVEASLEATQDHVSQITNILEEIEELPGPQDVPSSHEAGEEIDSLGNTISNEPAVGIEEEEEIEESPNLDAMPISHEEDEEIDSLEDTSDTGLYSIEEDAISDELAVGIEEQEELEESPSLDAMSISHEEEPPPVVMDLMKTSQSISTIEKTDNIYTLGNLQNLRDIYSSPELKEEHFQPLLEMVHKKFCADASTFLLWDELNSSYRVLLHNGLDAHTLKNLYFGFFDLFLDQNLPSQVWNLNTMRSNIFFAKRFSREFLQEKHVAHILNLARENSKHSVFLFLFYSHIPKQDMKNLMNEFFELFQDYLPALYRFRKSQWSDRTEEHYLEDMLCQTSRLIKELSSGGKDTVSVLHLKLKGLGQYSDKEHQSKIDSIIQELSRLLNQEEKCILNHTEGMIFLLKVCNPSYFIQQAHKLSSSEGLSVQTVLKHYPQDGKNIHNYLNADS